MSNIGKLVEILLGVASCLGWLVGMIAWIRRGLVIPRAVHLTAAVLLVVGIISAVVANMAGIRSAWVAAFALLGFPAWAYAGWFLLGCPGEDAKGRGYDISMALANSKRREGGRLPNQAMRQRK